MEANHSCSSSEQPPSLQPQHGETKAFPSSEKNEADTEVIVQSESQANEKIHSMTILSDGDHHKPSLDGSSSEGHENGSAACGVDAITEDREEQCVDDSSSSSFNDSKSWCDPSMLLDNSVEEFSITTDGNKDKKSVKVNLEQTFGEISTIRENDLRSTHKEELKSLTLSRESESEPEPSVAEQMKPMPENSLSASAKSQANSSSLQNEINSLLSATSPLCSPVLELEVGRVDFSTTPKENLMRMVSDLLDECDWLKKEKAR